MSILNTHLDLLKTEDSEEICPNCLQTMFTDSHLCDIFLYSLTILLAAPYAIHVNTNILKDIISIVTDTSTSSRICHGTNKHPCHLQWPSLLINFWLNQYTNVNCASPHGMLLLVFVFLLELS